jgi:hypothetical protein
MNEDRVHFQEGGMVHTVSKSCLRGMGLSAGFMCILFLLYGINPQAAALAADSTVISEPLSGSYVNRLTASAFPIEIRDTIPQDDAGIVNFARVPDHTAVAVLVRAVNGIDLDAPSAVRFSIDDGYHLPYPRYLGHDAVRAVKLNQDPDGQATHVWLTYDRCLEPFMPTAYPLDAVVRVTVTIFATIFYSRHPLSLKSNPAPRRRFPNAIFPRRWNFMKVSCCPEMTMTPV